MDPDLPIATARPARAAGSRGRPSCAGTTRPSTGRAYDLAVVRSCWDYAWRLEEFLAWAESVPRLRNPRRGRCAGTPTRPTCATSSGPGCRWCPPCGIPAGATSCRTRGSGSSSPRSRPAPATPRGGRSRPTALAHAAELTAGGRTAMVQPYLASVDDVGETAMLFIGGRFSHAVRKGPLLAARRRRAPGPGQPREPEPDAPPRRPSATSPHAVFDAIGTLVPDAAPPLYARIDLVARRGRPAGRPGAGTHRAQPVPPAGARGRVDPRPCGGGGTLPVSGVLGGFAALAAVIAVGWLVGRTGILGAEAPGMLSRLSFFVATPALLFLTLAEADTASVVVRRPRRQRGQRRSRRAAVRWASRGGAGGCRRRSSRSARCPRPTSTRATSASRCPCTSSATRRTSRRCCCSRSS